MLPHIIITGMPMLIMDSMRSQQSFIISEVMPDIGIILQTMVLPTISQVMLHIIGAIIICGIIIGIMPPMFIICGIIPPIMFGIIGMPIFIMFGIIGICGIIPPIFIIGIAFIMIFS